MQVARLFINKYLFLSLGMILALLSVFLLFSSAAAQEGVIEIDTSPDMIPVLSVIHNNTSLQISATDNNLNANSWQNVGPLTYEPDCELDNLNYRAASAANAQVVLTESDNGSWYCFKVADGDDNVGYAKYRVTDVVIAVEVVEEEQETEEIEETEDMSEPVAAPLISLKQIMNNVLQAASSVELVDPVWQVLIVASVADCSFDAFERAHPAQIGHSSRVSGLTGHDNGNLYCFRVSDSGLSYGYGVIQVSGLAAPVQSAPVISNGSPDSDDSDSRQDSDEQEMDDDDEDDDDEEEDDDKEDDDDDAAGSKGDEDDDNLNLRLIGGAIVAVGVLALIGVFVFSKKQSDSQEDEDDAEDKEL